jgi:hypothetical protein
LLAYSKKGHPIVLQLVKSRIDGVLSLIPQYRCCYLYCILKGLSHEIFVPVFWTVIIPDKKTIVVDVVGVKNVGSRGRKGVRGVRK